MSAPVGYWGVSAVWVGSGEGVWMGREGRGLLPLSPPFLPASLPLPLPPALHLISTSLSAAHRTVRVKFSGQIHQA